MLLLPFFPSSSSQRICKTGQDQTCSVRTRSDMFSPDKIRHVQFRHVGMLACWHVGILRGIFRQESKTIELRFVLLLLLSVTNCCTLIKIKHDQCWTGSDTIRVSQICDGKWPAEGGFSVTNLGNLDKIRHDQGFPNM